MTDLKEKVPTLSELPPPRPGRFDHITPLDLFKRFGIIGIWALMIVIFGALKSSIFLTASNFQTMFDSQAVLLLLSLALLVSMISGDFDLSVAGVFSMDLVIIGKMNIVDHINPLYCFLVVIGLSLAVGLIQAALIVKGGLSSFIVTLGTGTAFMGVAYAINQNAVAGVSADYNHFMSYRFGGLQIALWISFAVVVLLWYVYGFTPLGRRLFFVGANRNVARLAGINVNRLRMNSLVTGSLLAALAAIVTSGYLNEADPSIASNFLLPALSGALLGTTCIWPGRPNPVGTFVATYFLVTGYTGLEELGLNGWIQQVFYGVALVAAVGVSTFAARRSGSEAAGMAAPMPS
jgi:ribose transport system permease protein